MSRLLAALALCVTPAAMFAAVADPQPLARCTNSADFDLYAIPSGYENGTKDVFVKGVPRGAKQISVRFVYVASGRPVKASPFPLQTWVSRVQGFRRDGTLWVRIELEGYGFGMPVANVSHWRALVSYACRVPPAASLTAG